MMQSRLSSTVKAASKTVSQLGNAEGRQNLQTGMYDNLGKAKESMAAGAGAAYQTSSQMFGKASESVSAGAGVAYESSSQVLGSMGEKTKQAAGWTADSLKQGASTVYEAGSSGASVAKDKLD